MSYNSSDDGVEFFGGLVNVTNLIVVGAEDDSIDTDTGVKANLQYVIAIQRPAQATRSSKRTATTPSTTARRVRTRVSRTRPSCTARRGSGHPHPRLCRLHASPTRCWSSTEGTACLRIDGQEELTRTTGPDEAARSPSTASCSIVLRRSATARALPLRISKRSSMQARTTIRPLPTRCSRCSAMAATKMACAVFDVTALEQLLHLPPISAQFSTKTATGSKAGPATRARCRSTAISRIAPHFRSTTKPPA